MNTTTTEVNGIMNCKVVSIRKNLCIEAGEQVLVSQSETQAERGLVSVRKLDWGEDVGMVVSASEVRPSDWHAYNRISE